MIAVHYFANIREQLKLDSEQFAASAKVSTVAELIDALVSKHGAHYDKVLRQDRVLVAVNQEVADLTASIKDGDELAFFPPVTGG